MSAIVRQAVIADANVVAAVHIKSWQTAYRGQLPDDVLDNLSGELERRTEFWREHISTAPSGKHEIWVADLEDQVASGLNGFAALGPARDEDAVTGELYAIYVHPDRWHHGLGRALLAHATRRLSALGYANAILWVLESNIRARAFYERAGWTLDGGTKIEMLPDHVELREVRYRIRCRQENEESCRKEVGSF
ncbi:MAG: GNAT family N-acetyltransferase [Candidatus Sulfotelmatobacter sp.]